MNAALQFSLLFIVVYQSAEFESLLCYTVSQYYQMVIFDNDHYGREELSQYELEVIHNRFSKDVLYSELVAVYAEFSVIVQS